LTFVRSGHHTYMLSPRPGLLHHREIARCLRHTGGPLDLPAAAVLHRALTCSLEGRARDALSNPAEHPAADRLIAAGLLEDDHGFLRPTPWRKRHSGQPPSRGISGGPHRFVAPAARAPAVSRVTNRCYPANQTAVTKVTGHKPPAR
jgi:hypothetical protein